MQEVLEAWSDNNVCVGEFLATDLPNINGNDNSTVTRISRDDCQLYTNGDGERVAAAVIHYRINSGGHTWPGNFDGWPPNLGTVNRDISASQEIWDFFSRHTLPLRSVDTACDLNADGLCDVSDLDTLTTGIVEISMETRFDLNGDSSLNHNDVIEWLSFAATENGFSEPYLLGDVDLDGTIGASDLNRVGLNWRSASNKWSDGDFNANGMVDADDLNTLALNWRDSISQTAAASAVPEPNSALIPVLLAAAFIPRKRRSISDNA